MPASPARRHRRASRKRSDLEVKDLSQTGYYADLSRDLAQTITAGENERGILICGTASGVCISGQ